MVIQDLKASKQVPGRWLASLEDGSVLRLGENEVADFALYPGRELTQEEGEALMALLHRNVLREKALDLLTRKPQSRWELERKLKEWGACAQEGASICERLEELGYLDDAAYAARVVEHYCAKGFGVRQLRDELYRRGVPREMWDDALARAQDPEEAIATLVARKLEVKNPDRKELKRLSDALARRGFAWQDISRVLCRYSDGAGEDPQGYF